MHLEKEGGARMVDAVGRSLGVHCSSGLRRFIVGAATRWWR